jgi:hypothetical protein
VIQKPAIMPIITASIMNVLVSVTNSTVRGFSYSSNLHQTNGKINLKINKQFGENTTLPPERMKVCDKLLYYSSAFIENITILFFNYALQPLKYPEQYGHLIQVLPGRAGTIS